MRTLYIAHPIDQGQIQVGEVFALAHRMGVATYNPAAAWDCPHTATPSPGLQTANLAVLRNCDGLVACIDPNVMSIGVTLEIVEATNHDIPVLVWGRIRPSWALAYLHVPHTKDPDELAAWIGRKQPWN